MSGRARPSFGTCLSLAVLRPLASASRRSMHIPLSSRSRFPPQYRTRSRSRNSQSQATPSFQSFPPSRLRLRLAMQCLASFPLIRACRLWQTCECEQRQRSRERVRRARGALTCSPRPRLGGACSPLTCEAETHTAAGDNGRRLALAWLTRQRRGRQRGEGHDGVLRGQKDLGERKQPTQKKQGDCTQQAGRTAPSTIKHATPWPCSLAHLADFFLDALAADFLGGGVASDSDSSSELLESSEASDESDEALCRKAGVGAVSVHSRDVRGSQRADSRASQPS